MIGVYRPLDQGAEDGLTVSESMTSDLVAIHGDRQ